MIRKNKTKEKLRRGEPVFGVIAGSAEPMLAEWAGLAGFDYFMLDGEHGLFNPADGVHVVRACELADITPLVRIGPKDPKVVLQYLDAGFMGVMMPGLIEPEDVRMLVDAVKFPPVGRRGLGPLRANDYHLGGMAQDVFLRFSNAETMVIPQYEDPWLLDRVGRLFGVPEVDAVMIGPRDLSVVMGAESAASLSVQDAIDAAIVAIKAAGPAVGITAATRSQARQQIARGAGMILTSAPQVFRQGAASFLVGD